MAKTLRTSLQWVGSIQSESWADSGRAPAGPGPSGGHGPALGYEEARTGKAGHPVSPLGQGQYCPRDVRNGCESTGWGQGGGHWRWCLQEWALGGLSAWGRWERECEADVKQCVCLCVCEMQWGVYVPLELPISEQIWRSPLGESNSFLPY